MKASELGRPGSIAVAVAAAAALGFVAGYLVARNPERVRRWMTTAAAGLERLTGSAAETREHLADLWAQARDEAKLSAEDEAFAAAEAAAAVSAAQSASSARAESVTASERPGKRRNPRSAARRTRRPTSTG